jgi:hypothetical protein
MSSTVRTVLVFLAAVTAALAAAPPVDLPGWAAALIAAAAAGFAGLGLLPPSWTQSGTHTAVKRNRPTREQEIGGNVKRKHELPVERRSSSHVKWMIVAAIVGIFGFAAAPALAAPPVIKGLASPAVNHVNKPTVINMGKLGKYRVTNTTLHGQPALRFTKITKLAHASGPYLHAENAWYFCHDWNNQSANDNIHYVEAVYSWPWYSIGRKIDHWTRYSNTWINMWINWFENSPSDPRLAIQYGCAMSGDDSNIVMQSVGGTAVFWWYYQ